MSFLLRPNWERLNKDIWDALEKLVSAPKDMYIELLWYRLSLIGKAELDRPENFEALNDPEKARNMYMGLATPPNEEACLSIVKGYFDILRRFPKPISQKFREKTSDWIASHNLRYVVDENCALKLTIQGLLMTQIEFLRSHILNQATMEALEELESSLSNLRGSNEIKNCLRAASNLLEGVASDRAGRTRSDFHEALNGCRDLFPHKALDESVRKIYSFFNDYPNIRHRGNPTSRLRDLKIDDALLAVSIITGFACFIHDNNSSEKILEGNI